MSSPDDRPAAVLAGDLPAVAELAAALDAVAAETRFSGVVDVSAGGERYFARAYGLAHRGFAVPNTVDTRFAIASGTKGFTALTIASLAADGVLALDTPARSLLGADLPEVDDAVTVEQLLAHRSGIGDYYDEEVVTDINDFVLPVPTHVLATTEDYLAVLTGHPQKSAPGTEFRYNNSAFVVAALVAERAAGVPFADLVATRVCGPAGLTATGFVRSNATPPGVAHGYLDVDGDETNSLHMPLLGSGDGGLATSAADVTRFWQALFDGRIVPGEWVARLTAPVSEVVADKWRYGLGFWLQWSGPRVSLFGGDPGISFRSEHDRDSGLTRTVLANTGMAHPMWVALTELWPAG